MEEHLISFETAKLAKEKGFKEQTRWAFKSIKEVFLQASERDYDEELHKEQVLVPTQSLLQKWLREKHFISVDLCAHSVLDIVGVVYRGSITTRTDKSFKGLGKYEDVLEERLFEALKLIK